MLLTKEIASIWRTSSCISKGVTYDRRVAGRFQKLKRKGQSGRRKRVGEGGRVRKAGLKGAI